MVDRKWAPLFIWWFIFIFDRFKVQNNLLMTIIVVLMVCATPALPLLLTCMIPIDIARYGWLCAQEFELNSKPIETNIISSNTEV